MTLAEAVAILEAKAKVARGLAEVERVPGGRLIRDVAEHHRRHADAIATVLSALPGAR